MMLAYVNTRKFITIRNQWKETCEYCEQVYPGFSCPHLVGVVKHLCCLTVFLFATGKTKGPLYCLELAYNYTIVCFERNFTWSKLQSPISSFYFLWYKYLCESYVFGMVTAVYDVRGIVDWDGRYPFLRGVNV